MENAVAKERKLFPGVAEHVQPRKYVAEYAEYAEQTDSAHEPTSTLFPRIRSGV